MEGVVNAVQPKKKSSSQGFARRSGKPLLSRVAPGSVRVDVLAPMIACAAFVDLYRTPGVRQFGFSFPRRARRKHPEIVIASSSVI